MKGIGKTLAIVAIMVVGMMTMSFHYQNTSLGFGLDLPDDWKLGEGQTAEMMVAMSPKEGDTDTFLENMNVIRTHLDQQISLQELYNLNLQNAQKQLPGFQALEVEAVDINGIPAIKLVYSFNYQDVKVKNIVYLMLHGSTMYTITFATVPERFAEMQPKFENMAKSLKLL